MAGEWIPLDINLGDKPEVQELIDLTGQGVETVVYRLFQLWGWASLNTADGTVRATPGRLSRVCGGDEEFWRAVEAVGWIVFDQDAGTAEIPGWGRRFSQAAKARACHADRQSRYRDGRVTVDRHENVTRGEERRGQVPPPPRKASQAKKPKQPADPAAGGWEALQAAWNKGTGERWRSPAPPPAAADRLAEDGWMERATDAIGHLPKCKFFRTPVTLAQFCGSGFVDRVLGGQYDRQKEQRPTGGYRGPDDKPPAQGFTGDDAARFEATRRKMIEHLKTEGAA
jgi:hypothetical protein